MIENEIITTALKASPENGMIYGVFAACLIAAVVFLWKYLVQLIDKHEKTVREHIDKNTEAFLKINQRIDEQKNAENQEKKKEMEYTDKVEKMIDKIIQLTEKVSMMIELQSKIEQGLVDKINAANQKLIKEIKEGK